jgi:hypothetical protein
VTLNLDKSTWKRVSLGNVIRHVTDRVDPENSVLERFLAGEHIPSNSLHIREWGVIGRDPIGPMFYKRFKPGHVLYVSRRSYLRKTAVPEFEGSCGEKTFVLDAQVIEDLVTGRREDVTAEEIEWQITARIAKHLNNPVFVELGKRLNQLREKYEGTQQTSLDFLREHLELARDTVAAEKAAREVPREERGKAALTELFEPLKTEGTPVIVENVWARSASGPAPEHTPGPVSPPRVRGDLRAGRRAFGRTRTSTPRKALESPSVPGLPRPSRRGVHLEKRADGTLGPGDIGWFCWHARSLYRRRVRQSSHRGW